MKIKTRELIGAALDWAVELAQDGSGMGYGEIFSPSTIWEQGGPIIERESISVERSVKMRGCAVTGYGLWFAKHPKNYGGLIRATGSGPTPLIAAMRCYVASNIGEEVDIDETVLGR